MDYPIFTEEAFELSDFVVWCPKKELFGELLLELEADGVAWPNGASVKGVAYIWDRYREETCICVESSATFGWDSREYFEENQGSYGPIFQYIAPMAEQSVNVEDLI